MKKPDDVNIAELFAFALDSIREMGAEALKFFEKAHHAVTHFDQALITQAELHLIESFQGRMKKHYPSHMIYGLGNLGDGYTHDDKRYLWVFDPLDGVDNFQSGIPIWGLSLALYENFWPVLGLFYMPATNDLFRAAAGEKAYWNDHPIQISNRDTISQESLLLTFSRFHQYYDCRFPGKIRDFGSIGAHACYVAMGRADAALTARESFKDLAAVRVILEGAGGKLLNFDGTDFYLGDYIDGQRIEQHLLLAGTSNVHAILDALTRVG